MYNDFYDRIGAEYIKSKTLESDRHVVMVIVDTKDMTDDDVNNYDGFIYKLSNYIRDRGYKLISIHDSDDDNSMLLIGVDILEEQNYDSFCLGALCNNDY